MPRNIKSKPNFDSVSPYHVILSIFTQQQQGLEMYCPFFCLHKSWDFHKQL